MAPADKPPASPPSESMPEPFPHVPSPDGAAHIPAAPGELPVLVEPGNEEFPVAFRHYAASLQGTDDEVWTRYLQIKHGHRNMTMSEWRTAHHSLRHELAHWHRG